MPRATGHYITTRTPDEEVRAFVPDPLPPALAIEGELAADVRGGLVQGFERGLRFVFRAEDGHKNTRLAQVARHPHVRHRDEPQARVLDASLEHLRDDLLNPVGDLPDPGACHVSPWR